MSAKNNKTLSRARKGSAKGKKQSHNSNAEDGDRVSMSETKMQLQEVKGELKSVQRSGSAPSSSTLKGPTAVSRPVTRSFLKQSTHDNEEVILPDTTSEEWPEEIEGEERLMESLNEMILNDEEGDDLEDVVVEGSIPSRDNASDSFPFGLSYKMQKTLLFSYIEEEELDIALTSEMTKFLEHCQQLSGEEKFAIFRAFFVVDQARMNIFKRVMKSPNREHTLQLFNQCRFDSEVSDRRLEDLVKGYKSRDSHLPAESSYSSISGLELDVSRCTFRLMPAEERNSLISAKLDIESLQRIILTTLFGEDMPRWQEFLTKEKQILRSYRKAIIVLSDYASAPLDEESQFTCLFVSYYLGLIESLPLCQLRLSTVPKTQSLSMKGFTINDFADHSKDVKGSKKVTLKGCTDLYLNESEASRPWETSVAHIELKSPYKKLWLNESGSQDAKAQLFAESVLLSGWRKNQRRKGKKDTRFINSPDIITSILSDMFLAYLGIYYDGKFYCSQRAENEDDFLLFLLFPLCRASDLDIKSILESSKPEASVHTSPSQSTATILKPSSAPVTSTQRTNVSTSRNGRTNNSGKKKQTPLGELNMNSMRVRSVSEKPKKAEIIYINSDDDSDEERRRLEAESMNREMLARYYGESYLSSRALRSLQG